MSETLTVRARSGLKVPREHQPHSYIDDSTDTEVPASAYYLRCLMYGDLVRITDKTTAKGAK